MAKQLQISKPSPRQTKEQAEATSRVRQAIIKSRNSVGDLFLEMCRGLVQSAPGQPGLEGCRDVESVFSRIMGCDRWKPKGPGFSADFEGRVSFRKVELFPEDMVFTYDPEDGRVVLKTSEDRPKVVGLVLGINAAGCLATATFGTNRDSQTYEDIAVTIKNNIARALNDVDTCDDNIESLQLEMSELPAKISEAQLAFNEAEKTYVKMSKEFEVIKGNYEASKSTVTKVENPTPEQKAASEAFLKDLDAVFANDKKTFDSGLEVVTKVSKALGELVSRLKSIPGEIKAKEDSKLRAQKELRDWTREEELFKTNLMTVKTAKAVVKNIELV